MQAVCHVAMGAGVCHVAMGAGVCNYSEIFDNGLSEIRTISLQRTQLEVPRYFLPIVPIHCGLLN